MSEKEEAEGITTEDVKSDESFNTACEEAPTSLETVPSETPVQRTDSVPAPAKDKTKIDVLLKATGNAPIMKQKKWSVSPDNQIGKISDFIKKYLGLAASDRLFLYVNQTFAPAPDQTVKNLYDCYGANGNLIIHYCKSPAWG